MDERDLLDRCVRRTDGAWEEFLARFRPVLERAARSTFARVARQASEDDVEAVVEAVLLSLVKDDCSSLRAFAGRSSFAGYLRAIGTNLALNHVRGERRKGWLRFRPLEEAGEPITGEAVSTDEVRIAAIQRALEGLPPRDRLLLKLFHFDGADYKEISAVTGLSTNAVSPALIRARERLRARIEGKAVTEE